ncbi:unnamed protein product [Rotaria magnacalcarata]|uniref:NHL repeat containing protein n=1 Tax=Rotaria magnacalcarata TaxID=392030 RepID=A0A816H7W3_9BILA|nr:unnamed protein product [Rotaria magnacalcarata]CAF1684134.1 unnamed protein product [Rotaria magnacalcarata]
MDTSNELLAVISKHFYIFAAAVVALSCMYLAAIERYLQTCRSTYRRIWMTLFRARLIVFLTAVVSSGIRVPFWFSYLAEFERVYSSSTYTYSKQQSTSSSSKSHGTVSNKLCLLNQINCEQSCDNSLPYQACSLNAGCGCLPLSHNNQSSICAFLSISCSELSSCARDNKTCYKPDYTCVKHSRCQTGPVCYPMQMATKSLCPSISSTTVSPMPDDGICDSATWDTNGTTVAGGNGAGSQLNQFHFPSGIFLDDDLNLYVTDGFNHRVVKWEHGSSVGQIVAGGNSEGNQTNQFRYPNGVIVGKNGTIFVCDDGNHRLQMWKKNAGEGETVKTNGSCFGLYIDDEGTLYYSEAIFNSILKLPNDEVIAGGNGQGDHLNQLSIPYYFSIKNRKSLLIADGDNHRIVEWIIGEKEGVVRAGGNHAGHNLNQFYQPMSVVADQSDNLYVADYDNNRIMRWLKNSKSGIVLVGERGEGKEKDQLYRPSQVLLDKHGNLWVNDDMNHRIQMFAIDKSSCRT